MSKKLSMVLTIVFSLFLTMHAYAMKIGSNLHYFHGYGYGFWEGDSPFVSNSGFGVGQNPSNTNPWKPEAINEGKAYDGPVRTMDWGITNHSGIVNWSDRRLPTDPDQTAPFRGPGTNPTRQGMAYEWMVDFANRTDRDLWLCIPHQASDEFVRNLARAVRWGTDGFSPYTSSQSNPTFPPLKAGLKAYVEFSNEIWNTIFDQHHYAADQGTAYWPSDASWVRAYKWGGRRAAEIHKIWTEEWSDAASRLKRVIAGFNDNTWVSDRILEGYDSISGTEADGFATAPYFGNGLNGADADIWSQLDSDIDDTADKTASHKAWAEAHGFEFYAYEGGNHTTTNGRDLNRHSNMYGRYINYLNKMSDYYEVFCHYVHVRIYNGSADIWGAVDHFGESPSIAHKWRAILSHIMNNNSDTEVFSPPTNLRFFNIQ